MIICILSQYQEPITWSIQLPYSVCETAFSQVELFLDTNAFTQISSQCMTSFTRLRNSQLDLWKTDILITLDRSISVNKGTKHV